MPVTDEPFAFLYDNLDREHCFTYDPRGVGCTVRLGGRLWRQVQAGAVANAGATRPTGPVVARANCGVRSWLWFGLAAIKTRAWRWCRSRRQLFVVVTMDPNRTGMTENTRRRHADEY
jgi:hypothetical protein